MIDPVSWLRRRRSRCALPRHGCRLRLQSRWSASGWLFFMSDEWLSDGHYIPRDHDACHRQHLWRGLPPDSVGRIALPVGAQRSDEWDRHGEP